MGLSTPQSYVAEVSLYNRDKQLTQYVKERVNGYCECCGKEAPFIKGNGEPYLEEHHLTPLSKGGADTIENVCAACPNCHRELHYGINKNTIMKEVENRISLKIKKIPIQE